MEVKFDSLKNIVQIYKKYIHFIKKIVIKW